MIIYHKIDLVYRIRRAQANCQHNFHFILLAPHILRNKCEKSTSLKRKQQSCRRPRCIRHFQPLTRVTVRGYMLNLRVDRVANFSMIPRWQDHLASTNLRPRGLQSLTCLTSHSYKLADTRDALIIDCFCVTPFSFIT